MADRILVTGASGGLGRVVVNQLLDAGYEVQGIDRIRHPDSPIRIREVDGTDVGQVAGAGAGCAGIIHLGAIPSPYGHADEVVFRNNTGATFAVFQAAHLLGIQSVVFASSISAYGMAWAPVYFDPLYMPIDEEHPMRNYDAYGLSKEVDELTAQVFVRRSGISAAALRFHWIADPEQILERAAAPIAPRDVRQGFGYVERSDAARACVLALEAAMSKKFEFAAMNIVAADTLATRPTAELLQELAPHIELRGSLPDFAGCFAIDRARQLIGWEPKHRWR